MSMTSIGILYIHLCKMLRKERFSPQHMATYLNQLISEPEEYLKYFWWEPYFQVISNEYPRMYGFLKYKFNLIQVEAYVDPVDPHQLPSTFPCNLCSHLHQAEQPTQVWDSIYPFKSWLPLFWRISRYVPLTTCPHQVSSLEKDWRQDAACQQHFSYHCNRFG